MSGPIVIVGAGVAGLALGLALKRAGRESIVLERRPELTTEGAGIQIGPNGTHVLRRLGVYEEVAAHASVPQSIIVHDGERGRELVRLPLGAWIARRHGSPYWVVLRFDLVRALRSAAVAAGVEVRFGADVLHTDVRENDVSVALADGSTVRGSGLVGADGLWSRVREQHFPEGGRPTVTGRVALRALIEGQSAAYVRRDAISLWMAREAHLVTYPVAGGDQLNVVLVVPGAQAAPDWSHSVDADDHDLLSRFSAFPTEVRALRQRAGTWLRWPLMSCAPLTTYAHGRVSVIGDAAHPTMPFLAQGGVMALEDAEVLAACLARSEDAVAQAFFAFSHARLARTQRVVRAATRNGRIYHLGGAAAMARNTVLRVMPPAVIMSGYDWLYGGASEMPA